MKRVSLALVGLGGYGGIYADALLAQAEAKGIDWVAGIDPYAEKSGRLERLQEAGVPIYPSLEAFYRQQQADLVVIAAAIHLHAPLTQMALLRGASVLCEKPLCGGLEEIQQMARAEAAAAAAQDAGERKKFVAIGYQWSFAQAIQALKRDVLAGALGKPRRLKTLVLWPRAEAYFRRNEWAGKVKSEAGTWVLDSPVHNATAHYLHNMLYVLGERREVSLWPDWLQGECCRANVIENFDAAALRVEAGGAEILFYTAHSVKEEAGPLFEYEFERATVHYRRGPQATIQAFFHDGQVRDYGDPNIGEMDKLWQAVEAVRGGGEALACGIEGATPEVLCVHALRQSAQVQQVPPHVLRRDRLENGDSLNWVEGLGEAFSEAYRRNLLPGELGRLPWLKTGSRVEAQAIYRPGG